MNRQAAQPIARTSYAPEDCQIGFVHLGFGAFHRAHQAVFLDDYMDTSGDLAWGIAAVNLRPEQAREFAKHSAPYLLKTTTPFGETQFREVRSHIAHVDWSTDAVGAEILVSKPSVHAISISVTESGYYLDATGTLNLLDPIIAEEISGGQRRSVYAYLLAALRARMDAAGKPISILCCDNIRSNGDMLKHNFRIYLAAMGECPLSLWLDQHATFPNSMVDRITPRATPALHAEIAALSSAHADNAIHGEDFIQWVLEDRFAAPFPALGQVGVEVVADVDPFEEAKIRILNGGHTALCYLGALAGYQTFDQAMSDVQLRAHFDAFERDNVLPGLTIDLPFDKSTYCDLIAARFSNAAIADDLARICMDGWSKFPIFVRPTLASCLAQGIDVAPSLHSIASWIVYARRFRDGQTHVPYTEPYWDKLKPLLDDIDALAHSERLWADLPIKHPNFAADLIAAIDDMETQWPI